MDAIRKLVGFVAALTIVAFGLPAMAQQNNNKHYRLSMVVGTPDNQQQGSIVMATITNDNPSGSSSQIGSFTLSLANNASGLVIVSAITAVGSETTGGTVTYTDNSVTVTGINPMKPGDSYTVQIGVNGCGDGNGWAAAVWSGPTLNGTPYGDDFTGNETTNVPCGLLACDTALGGIAVSSLIDTTLTDKFGNLLSRREPYNQDGSSCNNTSYYVTELLAASALHVRWDTDPSAVFFYVLDQPLGTNPLFAWKTDNGDPISGNPIYVPAQACDQGKKAQFPAPLGTLALADTGTTQITVTATAKLPPTPFRIALGPKPKLEFLTVTKVSQSTWTVVRGNPSYSHDQAITVMSSPAPALPSALSCFADSAGTIPATCPYVTAGPALMCYVPSTDTTRSYIFDIGDGWVPVR